jgi:hypothetical protein
MEYLAIRRPGKDVGVSSIFVQLNLIDSLPVIPDILANY